MWYNAQRRALCTKTSEANLFTDYFMEISPRSSEQIQLCMYAHVFVLSIEEKPSLTVCKQMQIN